MYSKCHFIDTNSMDCKEQIYQALVTEVKNIQKSYDEICIACIGTDRSTGDSLGPLVGYKLKNNLNARVVGNLDNPLHAMNIDEFVNTVNDKTLVIAVDACLGRSESVGYITIGQGPIRPGSGVGKHITPIGDIHITGIVNFGGIMDFMVLQNTRLSVVMQMADAISFGLNKLLMAENEVPEIVEIAVLAKINLFMKILSKPISELRAYLKGAIPCRIKA